MIGFSGSAAQTAALIAIKRATYLTGSDTSGVACNVKPVQAAEATTPIPQQKRRRPRDAKAGRGGPRRTAPHAQSRAPRRDERTAMLIPAGPQGRRTSPGAGYLRVIECHWRRTAAACDQRPGERGPGARQHVEVSRAAAAVERGEADQPQVDESRWKPMTSVMAST